MKVMPKRSKHFEIFRNIFLFQRTKTELAESVFLSPLCECFQFEPGEYIFTRDHFRKCMGIVVSGEVRAIKQAKDGTFILLNTFFSSGIFGVAGLFVNSQEYVSDIQVVRRSKVLFLPEELLRSLFRREPMTAENYISYLATRIQFLNKRIDIFTGGTAEQRLAGYLLSICPACYPYECNIPVTYQDLSKVLNVGRASLYRAFDSLERFGIITREGRVVTILDLEVLRGII